MSHRFHGSRRFYLYYYGGYLCFLHCILQHFTLRFAAKRTAFSGKLHCILQQNTLHLAAKRTAFSIKLHCILLLIGPKQVQMAVLWNINSFYRIRIVALFCIKTNLRENRLFGTRCAVGGQKGHS